MLNKVIQVTEFIGAVLQPVSSLRASIIISEELARSYVEKKESIRRESGVSHS